MERDSVIRSDPAWQAAAEAYLALKAEVDATSARLDEAKAKLIGLAGHSSEKGCGVSVARYWKTGSVDYKNVPELAGVDLERYRSAGREVSVVKCGTGGWVAAMSPCCTAYPPNDIGMGNKPGNNRRSEGLSQ